MTNNAMPSEQQLGTCPIFQKRFFHNFPQWAGQTHAGQMEKLYNLAAAITLKNDAAAIWDVLESNPFLMMYFGYQIDRIHHMALGKNGSFGIMISGLLFLLGGLWSLYVNKMDPTLTHLLSLFMGGLGAMLKVYGQRFLQKRREKSGMSQASINGDDV